MCVKLIYEKCLIDNNRIQVISRRFVGNKYNEMIFFLYNLENQIQEFYWKFAESLCDFEQFWVIACPIINIRIKNLWTLFARQLIFH